MKNSTKIYSELRNDITFAKFKPGERLSEKLLTEKYKVSRATIREIIGQLSSQGYLVVEPYRGAVVAKLSLEDVDITYRILTRCESLAASLTAKNAEKSLVEKLKNCQEEMNDNPKDHKRWLQLNDIFHQTICTNCGSPILADLICDARLRIYRYRMVETDPGFIQIYNKHHDRIIRSILNKDQEKAEKYMLDHMEVVRKNRLKMFEKFADLGLL